MRKFLSLLMLISATTAAQAIPIEQGSVLSLFGVMIPDPVASTIEFYPGISLVPQAFQETGTFSALQLNNMTLTWQNIGTDIPYAALGTGSDLFCGSTCLMVYTDPTHTGWLNVTTPLTLADIWSNTNAFVNIQGSGIMSLTGFDPTPGTWGLAIVPVPGAPYGWWGQFGFTAETPTQVPGPIVGAGLPGLAAFGTWLLWRLRKRRHG